jgi:hypothetical protein
VVGEQREWRNSWFGRALGSVFGFTMVIIPLFVTPDDGSSPTAPGQVLIAIGVAGVGVAVLLAVWTSRLVLVDGVLTAFHFARSRSVKLADVESVVPAFWPLTGLMIKTSGGRRIRTLVSGSAQDEFWTTRACWIM